MCVPVRFRMTAALIGDAVFERTCLGETFPRALGPFAKTVPEILDRSNRLKQEGFARNCQRTILAGIQTDGRLGQIRIA